MRRFLFFLVGAGFLSIVLTACAGGGSSGSGGDGGLGALEVNLTFAPMSGGFRIGNQSDFGDMVSLDITATSGGNVEERDINITEFADDSYDFINLADLDWKFQITGTLGDGRQQEVKIVFTWQENRDDHAGDGIRSGVDTDGDRRADSVDEDDDNDRVLDGRDNCRLVVNPAQNNTDGDTEGDACDGDDDNDGLDDDDEKERLSNSAGVSCSLLADCDGDSVRDIDEVAANCVIKADCDDDRVEDRNEAAGCVLDRDCDRDSVVDEADIDDDGDGLIEIATPAQLDEVRHALSGNGSRSAENAALDTTGCGGDGGITSCSGYELVANISLAAYRAGKGWQPLGHDTNNSADLCQGAAFSGTFEGNGWTISDLNISRSGEDCVGLFGHVAADAMIRNLTLHAERMAGRDLVGGLVGAGVGSRIHSSSVVMENIRGYRVVGGLVGWGREARIDSSSVVVAEVRGVGSGRIPRASIGGLVGDGLRARIVSSSVVVAEVSGDENVGGLVGDGTSAQVRSSSVVAGEVSGDNNVGGLVGDGGSSARLHSSSVVAGAVRGGSNSVGGLVGISHSSSIFSSLVVVEEITGVTFVGGLVGDGQSARLHSSSVVVGEVSGKDDIGGLVGSLGRDDDGRVAYSYVVSGSPTPMLVGFGSGTGNASYWDSDTSGIDTGNHGEAKTTNQLRMPTGYDGIYASWDEDMDIFGDDDEPLAVWCDEDNSGDIESEERISDNLIWDFGTSSQYPAIRCPPLAPAEWRSWWFLNSTDQPQLNQTLLDERLPSLN